MGFYGSVSIIAICISLALGIDNPEDFVNLLAGSFTDGNVYSTGNTLPLVGYPWGFNHWAPQTRENGRNTGSWWFRGSEHRFTWIRCTHQPSPWIGDWGWFLIGPQLGYNGHDVSRSPTFFWEPRSATIKPHIFDTTVAPDGVRIELVPSMHGAMLRVTFPSRNMEKRICLANAEWTGSGMSSGNAFNGPAASEKEKLQRPSGKPYITGKNHNVHIERMIVANFNMHIRAESDQASKVEPHGDVSCFVYSKLATEVTVMVATSMVSAGQAMLNLNREIRYMERQGEGAAAARSDDARKSETDKQFDVVAYEARRTWNELLRRVDVVDPGPISGWATRNLEIFYSGLARALSFPRRIDEVDIDGNMVHYSPYSPRGDVVSGPGCTDNGFWDTFRTVYPMLSLLYPDHLGQIVQGWLNAFKEGGWLPSWASPGYRNCMVGTFADVVIADAIIKDVKGFDRNLAKAALTKDSFDEPPAYAGNAIGKNGLNQYKARGFLVSDDRNRGTEVVSRSLDFGFADFAVANAFHKLAESSPGGEKAELTRMASDLTSRSNSAVKNLFSSEFGLMAPKDSNLAVRNWFKPTEWGNGFTEGNAWHHSFPPYAVNAEDGGLLSKLHKGKGRLAEKIREMITMPSTFSPGSYGQEIHEMIEARALAMGQYGHNNQPVHHILYLLFMLGDRRIGEEAVRRVVHKAYGTDFFAGDEDNGEQGAWFVLSALGLFSTTPGTPDYVLGTPLFRHVRINRNPKPQVSQAVTGNGAVGEPQHRRGHSADAEQFLDIVALGTSETSIHVNKVTMNDRPVTNIATISDTLLQKDGVLRFYFDGEDASAPFNRNAKAPAHASVHPAAGGTGGAGDTQIVNALKEQLQAKEEEMNHYKEQEEGLVHVLHTEIDTLKQRDTEQGEILLELEDKLRQAGVSMNATSALLSTLHKERREHSFPSLQHFFLAALLLVFVAAVAAFLRRRVGLGRWSLSGLNLPNTKEKDEA